MVTICRFRKLLLSGKNIIFYHDKFKCWFVYDKDEKEYTAFEALDTDSQIAFLAMLDNFLSDSSW